MFDHSFPACAFVFVVEVEISSRELALLHSLCQDQSTVAQRAETTVAECSLMVCLCTIHNCEAHREYEDMTLFCVCLPLLFRYCH